MASTIDHDVQVIRQGIYGKDVREAIADGIEKIGELAVDISGDYSSVVSRVSTLENSTIKKTQQTLTTSEKEQVRSNIGAKSTQNAVSNPTASGNATTFVDSITQNANGVISPTRKTIPNASSSAAGLMTSADKKKLDGIDSGAQANSVTGVKGNAEGTYRTGNINLTPANIGAQPSGSYVQYSAQSLSTEAKAQARTNIGAQVSGSYVQYSAQSLSTEAKAQARTNIGAQVSGKYVTYDVPSTPLTTSEKLQARENIGAQEAGNYALSDDIFSILDTEFGAFKFGINENYAITRATGSATSSINWNASYYIPVTSRKIALTCLTTNNQTMIDTVASIAFFSDRTTESFISSIGLEQGDYTHLVNRFYDVPSDAKYYRVSIYKELKDEYRLANATAVVSSDDAFGILKSAYDNTTFNINENYAIGKATGSATSSINWNASYYIPVTSRKIALTCLATNDQTMIDTVASIAFFSDRTTESFISSIGLEQGDYTHLVNRFYDVPSDAKYYRVSIYKELKDEYRLFDLNDVARSDEMFDALDSAYSNTTFGINENYAITRATGSATPSTNWNVSNYIPVTSRKIALTCLATNNQTMINTVASIAFFSDRTADAFISSIGLEKGDYTYLKNKIINVPSMAKYYRVSIYKELKDEYRLFDLNDVARSDEMLDALDSAYSNTTFGINEDYAIGKATGSATSSINWNASYYIPVTSRKIALTCLATNDQTMIDTVASIAFFSEETTASFISSIGLEKGDYTYLKNKIINVPSKAKYYRVSIYKELKDEYRLFDLNDVARSDEMLETLESICGLTTFGINENYAITRATGSATPSTNWNASYYISVTSRKIALTCLATNNQTMIDTVASIAFFSDRTADAFISSIGLEKGDYAYLKNKIINVPSEAKYYRVSIYKELKDEYKLIDLKSTSKDKISTEIINLPSSGDDQTSDVIIDIKPDKYYTVETYRLFGHNLIAQAYINNVWKRIRLLNVDTGKESTFEYQHGEYYLFEAYGSNRLRFICEKSDTNSLTLILNEYYVPPHIRYSNSCTSSYLPKIKNSKVLNFVKCFGIYDGYIYGRSGSIIKRANISTGDIETFYTHTCNIGSSMIFDNGNILFTESSDENNKMYLLKNGDITLKHDFYNQEYNMRLTPSDTFSYNYDGPIAVVSEYNSSKTPISGYHSYITRDHGNSWNEIFDLTTLIENPSEKNVHLHSACYDKYGKMYWACNGDLKPYDMIWYSLDGDAWYPVQSPYIAAKPTRIIPMRDCVLFLSDSRQVMLYKWQRKPIIAGDYLSLDTVKSFIHYWKNDCPIGCHAYYDEKNNVAYFGYLTEDTLINKGYDGNLLKYSDVFVTDGNTVNDYYKDDTINGLYGVYGDDDHVVIASHLNTVIVYK